MSNVLLVGFEVASVYLVSISLIKAHLLCSFFFSFTNASIMAFSDPPVVSMSSANLRVVWICAIWYLVSMPEYLTAFSCAVLKRGLASSSPYLSRFCVTNCSDKFICILTLHLTLFNVALVRFISLIEIPNSIVALNSWSL